MTDVRLRPRRPASFGGGAHLVGANVAYDLACLCAAGVAPADVFAGWACHLGGGDRGFGVWTMAAILLYVDGLPTPAFSTDTPRGDILTALRAT